MKYVIFANNTKIKEYKQLDVIAKFIHKEDIIVTCNHCLPMDYLFAKTECKTIYHISRCAFNTKIPYSGLPIINANKKIFDRIYCWPHPDVISDRDNKAKALNYIQEHTSFVTSDFSHMKGFAAHQITKDVKNFLSKRYNKNTNLSTGLVIYLYIKQIKEENDRIYTVGFEHHMNKEKHNWEGERDYFQIEKEKGICHAIDLVL